MRRTLVALAMAVLALAALAVPAVAGGGGHDGGRCPGFTEGEQVLLRDGCIEGTGHFLAEGSDLTVVNAGIAPHDYTAVDGSFATGVVQPGEEATVEAPAAGVYRVYCTLHASAAGQGMAGVLVVGDLGPEALAAAGTAASAAGTGSATSGSATSGVVGAGLGWPAGAVAAGLVVAAGLLAAGMLLAARRHPSHARLAAGPRP